MDAQEYTSLQAALSAVPDPRHARGQRYPWPLLLTLVSAAMLSGQRGMRGIGQWVSEHAEELIGLLAPPSHRLPSTSTLRRAVRAVDVEALEARIAAFVVQLPAPPAEVAARGAGSPAWIGQAMDGKALRGANRHGARVHLLSLVGHTAGFVLGQRPVAEKSNEIPAAPDLLRGHDLRGTVTTVDAQLTQRTLAQQILDEGGHYLMVVKPNQPALHAAIAELFTTPPPAAPPDAVDAVTTRDKGHGRLETRRLQRSAALNNYVDWPGVGQVLRRTCRRVIVRTGEVQEEVTYGISSLPVAASAAQIEVLWRGHWTIENRVHYVRDVTFGEDAGQAWTGHTPQVLAALRNGLLSLLRALGWTNIADALRHYGAYAHRAIHLLAVSPPRL